VVLMLGIGSGADVTTGAQGRSKIWEEKGLREDQVRSSTPKTPASPDPPTKS